MAERERATGAQMAIAIFPSLEGQSVEDVSIKLAEQWRIGQKGLDNGVILVVFVADRKVRLEVGYGLEPTIPDAVAGRIIREVIAPRFREGRYAAGLDAAVAAVYQHIDEVKSGKAPSAHGKGGGAGWPVVGFVFLLGVIAVILGLEASRSQRFVGRRGYTAGGGGWSGPVIVPGPWWGGSGRRDSGGDSGFSGGGGGFGGGGASGEW
jgi:uncharacterized protein